MNCTIMPSRALIPSIKSKMAIFVPYYTTHRCVYRPSIRVSVCLIVVDKRFRAPPQVCLLTRVRLRLLSNNRSSASKNLALSAVSWSTMNSSRFLGKSYRDLWVYPLTHFPFGSKRSQPRYLITFNRAVRFQAVSGAREALQFCNYQFPSACHGPYDQACLQPCCVRTCVPGVDTLDLITNLAQNASLLH